MHAEKIVTSVPVPALPQVEAQTTILQLNKTLESNVALESGRSPCNKSPRQRSARDTGYGTETAACGTEDLGRSGLEDSIRRSRLRLRPKAKNVAVRIFELKLVGPAEILRQTSDVCAFSQEFGEKHIGVFDTDVEPDSRLALSTLTT